MDVHPSGDHLIVGGYDRKLCWFDLELSEKPYKILRYALACSVVISLTNAYISIGGTDITLVRSDHFISILHIRCLHRRPMMARSKSSMRACIATFLQILSSCRSRSCAGMMCVMVWECCRLDGFPSNHGWSAPEQIARSPSGVINEMRTCNLSDTSDGLMASACTFSITHKQSFFFLFLRNARWPSRKSDTEWNRMDDIPICCLYGI